MEENLNVTEGTCTEEEKVEAVETVETATTENTGAETETVTPSREPMSVEAKEKQADTMKERWADPIYRAKVARGRAAKKVAKIEAEIAEINAKIAESTNENAAALLVKEIEKLQTEVVKATTILNDAIAICGPIEVKVEKVTPEVTEVTEEDAAAVAE